MTIHVEHPQHKLSAVDLRLARFDLTQAGHFTVLDDGHTIRGDSPVFSAAWRGREIWFSVPVTLEITNGEDSDGYRLPRLVEVDTACINGNIEPNDHPEDVFAGILEKIVTELANHTTQGFRFYEVALGDTPLPTDMAAYQRDTYEAALRNLRLTKGQLAHRLGYSPQRVSTWFTSGKFPRWFHHALGGLYALKA